LVAAMEAEWDPASDAYADTYHDDLLALIKRKAAGEIVEAPPPTAEEPAGAEVVDIMDLLKRSLEEKKAAREA
jgi:non-homologous end joining protein Ku